MTFLVTNAATQFHVKAIAFIPNIPIKLFLTRLLCVVGIINTEEILRQTEAQGPLQSFYYLRILRGSICTPIRALTHISKIPMMLTMRKPLCR